MSSIFSKPKTPDIPRPKEIKFPEVQQIAPVETITEDATAAARRRRKKISTGGRRSTILSGIQTALKKRLGE